jgi:hypothetical protein
MLRLIPPSRSGKSPLVIVLSLTVVTAAAAFAVPYSRDRILSALGMNEPVLNSQYVLKKAEKAPFRIMITENGTVDSMRNAVLSNSVEGSTTIITLVPEGSRVLAPSVADFDGVIKFMDSASESSKTIRLTGEDGK